MDYILLKKYFTLKRCLTLSEMTIIVIKSIQFKGIISLKKSKTGILNNFIIGIQWIFECGAGKAKNGIK
jgi:hypothetical protein